MSERPTPRSIAICALIALRSDPSSPFQEIDFNPLEQDQLTTFLEDSVFSGGIDSMAHWMGRVRRQVGLDVAELLLDTLFLASESVDSLVDLMESLRAAIAEGLVDAVSAHGVYLRQICLGFEELSFESVTFLWQEWNNQLDVAKDVVEAEDDDDNIMQDTDYMSLTDDGFSRPWPLSTAQVEDVLRQACFTLHQGTISTSLSKDPQSYEAVELQVRSMLEKDPEVPAAYLLRFLNCLRFGERVGALDSLHQFFDHAMVQNKTPTEILQFSAILLSIAHHSFGNKALALMATEEAVKVAQQSKDSACVAFALGWLFENGGHGTSERRELLKRCATRARQGQIRALVTGSSLRLALTYLEDNVADIRATWMSIIEAVCEPSADNLALLDRPAFLTPAPQETMASLARQSLVSAGVWDAFGMPVLSGLSSMVALKCHRDLSAEETMSAIQNIGRLALYGTPSQLLLSDGSSDGETSSLHCKAVASIAYARQAQGLDGRIFDDAFLPGLILVLHELAVNRGNQEEAEVLETVLHSTLRPGKVSRDQLLLDLEIQRCRHLCRRQDWDQARKVAKEVLKTSEANGLKVHRTKMLIQLACVELESNPKHFTSALPHLLEALAICEASAMYGLHAVALSVLARVFLRLRNSKRALAILNAAMPTLLQREHTLYQAEAYLTNARCHLQLAGDCTKAVTANKEFRAALERLKHAEQLFQQTQDTLRLREVYYLQARVFAKLDLVDERETASQKYLRLSESMIKNRSSTGVLRTLTKPSEVHRLVPRI